MGDIHGEDVPDGIEQFKDVNLAESLMNNLALAGFKKPTPVQKHALPITLGRRDLMACAQTGSGKTAAFLFPLISALANGDTPDPPRERQNNRGSFGRRKSYPQGLIMAPTRELATQIFEEAQKFSYRSGLRPVVIHGGQDIRQQFRELERGVDFVVATPGRLFDMLERGRISMEEVMYLIFDEADRMLDMGFEPQIRQIVERYGMPTKKEGRLTSMFSATFPKEIQRLATDFLLNYIFLAVGRVGSSTSNIKQRVMYCQEQEKKSKLMTILPECEGLTLIFVETKRGADALEMWLQKESINATSIHGDRSQSERERALQMFRHGRCPVLVATSVAARGLDIPNVMHVINNDMPNNIDDYVHRIGRTGRCGNTGTAISLVGNKENKNVIRELLSMLQESKQAVPVWFSNMVA